MNKEKIIIFDLWQTLADSPLRPSDLFRHLNLSAQVVTQDDFLNQLFSSSLFTEQVNIKDELPKFLKRFEVQSARCDDALLLWERMVKESCVFPGAEALLSSLVSAGYTMVLLTNVDKHGFENFPYQSLLGKFDYMAPSYITGILKPDSQCWELIRERYQCLFEDMVMIGDSITSDIEPAHRLGLETVKVSSGTPNMYGEIYSQYLPNLI